MRFTPAASKANASCMSKNQNGLSVSNKIKAGEHQLPNDLLKENYGGPMRTIIRNSPLSFIIYLSIYSMNNVCHWPLPSSSPTLRLKPNTIFHIEQYKREFKIKHWSGRASHGVPLERPSERWLTRQGQIRLIADGRWLHCTPTIRCEWPLYVFFVFEIYRTYLF